MSVLYHGLNTYLVNNFGCRVHKISIDAGLTCPNRDGTLSTTGCIYCNARGSGTGAFNRGHSITDQIERGKAALAKRYGAQKFMAYFQSFSNTYAPIPVLKQLYDEALSVDNIVGLSIGTRPDCIDGAVLDLLSEYAQRKMVWLEYGLQSCHDTTLALINRGHDYRCFETAVAQTRNRGIAICAHVILGLPNESHRHVIETADAIAMLNLDGIKLHLLYVIRGTGLEALYRSGRYRCLTQPTYVEWVCDFLERIPPETVIHRLTGDPHPNELVAPLWALNKNDTLKMIRDTLIKRASRQGSRFTGCENENRYHRYPRQ